MPFKSKAQKGLMFAAAKGDAKMPGAPGQKEARKFIADSRGDKQNKLPQKVAKKKGKKMSKMARDKRLEGKPL